jgi:hypothetical protein
MASAFDTTRGINVKGVPKMKDAITKYQKSVDSACGNALTYAGYRKEIEAAMAGTQTLNNLNKYLTSLKNTQAELVKKMHQFLSVLDKIEAAYKNQDKNFTFK